RLRFTPQKKKRSERGLYRWRIWKVAIAHSFGDPSARESIRHTNGSGAFGPPRRFKTMIYCDVLNRGGLGIQSPPICAEPVYLAILTVFVFPVTQSLADANCSTYYPNASFHCEYSSRAIKRDTQPFWDDGSG